jgi:hypothetical protein
MICDTTTGPLAAVVAAICLYVSPFNDNCTVHA